MVAGRETVLVLETEYRLGPGQEEVSLTHVQ